MAFELVLMWLVMAVPCEKTPPPGMVCVEGGEAIVGADERSAAEKPRHSVYVETFYLHRTPQRERYLDFVSYIGVPSGAPSLIAESRP